MIDTMGTMIAAVENLKKNNIKDVIVVVTHGILSNPAIDRLNNCDFISKVIVTNSLCQKNNILRTDKLEVIDISELIYNTISNAV